MLNNYHNLSITVKDYLRLMYALSTIARSRNALLDLSDLTEIQEKLDYVLNTEKSD